jgi:hypothetical protein
MAIWRFGLGAPTSGGMTPALSADRLDRFARHIVLPEVGGAGQARIMGAHVVLVGVGGIGAPALQYLAGAGVGRLTLIDDDVVEPSNLQRQTIFTLADVGGARPRRPPPGCTASIPPWWWRHGACASGATMRPLWSAVPTWCWTDRTTLPRAWRCQTPAWQRPCR